jgi:hypothetical protein
MVGFTVDCCCCVSASLSLTIDHKHTEELWSVILLIATVVLAQDNSSKCRIHAMEGASILL